MISKLLSHFIAVMCGMPDYAMQASTNFANWCTLFTNSPTLPFIWLDTHTSAPALRFYRINVGAPLP